MLAILDKQRGLSPAKARLSPQVSGLIRDEQSATDAVGALTNALLFTAHQFNVVRNMAELQMGMLADELLQRYWFWRFDEFLYVLKEGVAQTWGKTYDRLDPPTVHEWCRAYQELRDQQIEHEATREADAYKKGELLPERVQRPEGYHAMRAKLDTYSDQDLVNGQTYYEHRPSRSPEEELKLYVVNELVNERRAQHYLRQIAKQLPAETASDHEAQAAAEAHRVKVALLQGNRAAAGLAASAPPGLYDNLPEAPQFNA